MKKILTLLLTGAMVLSLVACGGNNSSKAETDSTVKGEETKESNPEESKVEESITEESKVDVSKLDEVMIGVVISDPTNSEVIQLMDYLNFLFKSMPVTFKYSEAIKSPDDEISFIEDCAISGCKGIIGQYTDNAATAIDKCAEYEMFYTGSAEDQEIYEAYKENPYYLGGITYEGGDYEALYQMGKYLTDLGCKKIVYANGGADFGVKMFVDRQNGFKAAIEEAGLVYDDAVITVSGFPGDAFFSAQQAALSENGIDAVCASFNGVDYWVTPMQANGLTETVPLASYGSLNDTYVKAMEDGSLVLLAATNYQKYGIEAGLIFNAVNGDVTALKEDGTYAVNKAIGVWLFTNVEDAKIIFDIQENDKIFTADAIANLCTAVNADASTDTIQEMIDASTLENLLGR